jgi:hypothetical protein
MTPAELENLQSKIISQIMEETDKMLNEFFTPYFRQAGIKGEITRGKIKWRGIRMKVKQELGKTSYQLNQRGIDISPVFEIEFKQQEQ